MCGPSCRRRGRSAICRSPTSGANCVRRARRHSRAVMSREGGKRYELIDIRFAADTDYRTYRVHREATFHVRDGSGMELDLRVCGSMIEQDGAWKVFSYVLAIE